MLVNIGLHQLNDYFLPKREMTSMSKKFNAVTTLSLMLAVGLCVFGAEQPAAHVADTRAPLTDALLPLNAPTSEALDNDLCRRHGLLLKQGVLQNKLWALQMVDASSKFPSGLLSGSGVDLGNYDQCLSVEVADPEAGTFTGQHCMVSLGKLTFTNEINFMRKFTLQIPDVMTTDSNATLENWRSQLSVLWSVCVPSTCSPRDVETHLRASLRPWLGDVDVTILDDACNSNAMKVTLQPRDWLMLGVLIAVLILVAASTVYDIFSKSKSRNELCTSFSLKLHLDRLMKVTEPTDDDLPVLWGVRVLSMLWILTFHYWLISFLWPGVNFNFIRKKVGDCITCKFFANIMAVDTFFLGSGILVCFNFLKDREKGIEFKLTRFYFHRFVRLTPALFATILLATFPIVPGLMGGPLWKSNSNAVRLPCLYNWFYNLLFINNYQHPGNMCYSVSWYVSADMQLYLLSPLILYPLWRCPRLGKLLLCMLCIIANIISVFVTHKYAIHEPKVVGRGEIRISTYFPTHSRCSPWLVGVAVGYLLHHTKRPRPHPQQSTPPLPWWAVGVGWALSAALMLASLPFLVQETAGHTSSPLVQTFYLGLMRPAWALGVAWLIFALSRGYGPQFMTTFLSLKLFQVLSRICYSIYLIHFLLLLYKLGELKTVQNVFLIPSIWDWISYIFICTVFGAVVYLLVEAPPIYMEKVSKSVAKGKIE